jgi:hypothetical protein
MNPCRVGVRKACGHLTGGANGGPSKRRSLQYLSSLRRIDQQIKEAGYGKWSRGLCFVRSYPWQRILPIKRKSLTLQSEPSSRKPDR